MSTSGISYIIGIHFIAVFFVSIVTSRLSGRIAVLTGQIRLKEKRLKEMTALKNRIVDSVSSCIITTDKEMKVNFINNNAIYFFEHNNISTEYEIMGKNVNTLIPISELMEEDEIHVKRREYFFSEDKVIGINITKMYSVNDLEGYLLIFQDLSEFKKLEKRVAFKGNLESLGEMASGIAHEIRNPLASIKASIQLLDEDVKKSGDMELFRIVEDEIDRIELIVQDFLSFATETEALPKLEDIKKILIDVLTLFEKGLDNGISLNFGKFLAEEQYFAYCERGKVKKVIWNILKNAEKAVEYTEERKIIIDIFKEYTYVVISIEDTGKGIKDTDIKRIFDPYFSSFAKGSGLGLSICKKIMDDMNGDINIDSELGRGSCFKIMIPLKNGG